MMNELQERTELQVDIAELTKPFPPEALEQRAGANGKMLTYIKTHAVINRLNRACQYRWDWRIIEQHKEGELLICRGELTIPGLGTKAAVGVQEIRPNGGVDLWKGASSDALKKSATLFGVGIELYGEDIEDPDREARPSPQPRPPQPAPRPAYQSGSQGQSGNRNGNIGPGQSGSQQARPVAAGVSDRDAPGR